MKWISPKEKVPCPDDDVLVIMGDKATYELARRENAQTWIDLNGKIRLEYAVTWIGCDDSILGWIPLPKYPDIDDDST